MNIVNMAKSMNDVERYSPISVGDSYCPCADMDTDPEGEWVSYAAYAALQQQLAAAREALKSQERDARAWRNRFIDERMRTYEDKGYEMARCYAESDANDFIEAFHATLQRDRQP